MVCIIAPPALAFQPAVQLLLLGDEVSDGIEVSNGAFRFISDLKEGATFNLIAEASTDFGTAPTLFAYSDFRDQTLGGMWGFELENGIAREDSVNNGIVYTGRGEVSRALDASDTRVKIDLPDVTEIFISRALKIRSGGTWPGSRGWPNGQPEAGVFPSDSTFKMSWLFTVDDDGGGSNNNLCAPTHGSAHSISIAGNSHNFGGAANLEAVSHTGWSVVESWVRAHPENLDDDQGNGYIGVYSDQPNSIRNFTGTVFHPDKGGRGFVSVYTTGWIDKNGSEAVSFTDLYIASGAQRVVLADHWNPYLVSKYIIQPHTTWTGTKITGRLRLGELDPVAEPLYLHVYDTENSLVTSPLALTNEIKIPTGTTHTFGVVTPISYGYVSSNRLHVNPDSYRAQQGEMIRDMNLWVVGNSNKRTVFAIYENSVNDLATATKVYEQTREPGPLVQQPDISPYGAKTVSVQPLKSLTPGNYYWLASNIGDAYVIKADDAEATVLRGNGALADSISDMTLSEQEYSIGLNATILQAE